MYTKFRKISLFLFTLIFALNISVVSDAEMSLPGAITETEPQALLEGGIGLGSDQSLIINDLGKGSLQSAIATAKQLVIGQDSVYHPGEILLIPVIKGRYGTQGEFIEGQNLPQWKGVPSNWKLSVDNQSSSTIDDIRWHLSTEPSGENYLYVMVIFSEILEGTEQYVLNCNVCIEDTQTALRSNSISLTGSFENRSVEALPDRLNVISTPATVFATQNYNGEQLNFQIDQDVSFAGTTLNHGQTLYINLNRNYDSQFANKAKQFDLQFYNFLGNQDSFASPGNLSLPATGQEAYVYEITGGAPTLLVSNYDDEAGVVSITTESLGSYVVSNAEIIINSDL